MEKDKTTYYSQTFSRTMQEAFEAMRKNGDRCDLRIKLGEKAFPVHKIVIAAASEYFFDLLKSNTQNYTITHPISDSTWPEIIDFCYTSKLDLSAANATEILEVAIQLRMKDLVKLCVQYFDDRVSIENYGTILDAISRTALTDIPDRTFNFILYNFGKVAADRHLRKVNADSLVKILSSDQLNVKNEEVLLKVVRYWIAEDPKERISSLNKLLDCIRFTLIAPNKLLHLQEHGLSFEGLSDQSNHFLDLVNEAIDFNKLSKTTRICHGSEITHARHPAPYFARGSWIFIVYDRSILKYDLFHNTYTDITCPDTTEQKSNRTFLGGAVIEDKLYIVDDYGTMEIYDILRERWIKGVKKRQFSSHRSDYDAVFSAGDFVYVIFEDFFARFNSKTKVWQTIPHDVGLVVGLCDPLIRFKAKHHMANYDGKISTAIQGACSLDGEAIVIIRIRYEDVSGRGFEMSYKYNSYSSLWEGEGFREDGNFVNPGNFISFNGKLYSPQSKKLVCLDSDLKSYELPRMTLHRNFAKLFEIDGQIVVFGGEPTHTIEIYNTKSRIWSTIKLTVSLEGAVNVVKYVRKID